MISLCKVLPSRALSKLFSSCDSATSLTFSDTSRSWTLMLKYYNRNCIPMPSGLCEYPDAMSTHPLRHRPHSEETSCLFMPLLTVITLERLAPPCGISSEPPYDYYQFTSHHRGNTPELFPSSTIFKDIWKWIENPSRLWLLKILAQRKQKKGLSRDSVWCSNCSDHQNKFEHLLQENDH